MKHLREYAGLRPLARSSVVRVPDRVADDDTEPERKQKPSQRFSTGVDNHRSPDAVSPDSVYQLKIDGEAAPRSHQPRRDSEAWGYAARHREMPNKREEHGRGNETARDLPLAPRECRRVSTLPCP